MRTRLAVAFLALTAVPAALSAQMGMPGASGVRYGILIGTNLSTISDADEAIGTVAGAAIDKKRRVGLGAGVYATIPLAGMVSLQPEAHYDQKGVKFESNVTGAGDATASINLAYVEIPVLLRLDLAKNSSIHPVLFGGASGAFRIQCDISLKSGSSSTNEKCEETTQGGEDEIEKYDVSVVGGAGLAMSAMGRSIVLQLRYSQGLKNLATKESGVTEKLKNNTLSILLSLGF